MPIDNYSVLKGRAVDVRQGAGASPHYQILISDDADKHRIAINVQSQDGSMVQYLVRDHFEHPICAELEKLHLGLHRLVTKPGNLNLDYIRGNLLQPAEMKPLPVSAPGPDNDLNEKIGHYAERAMADEEALVYAFGEPWGPEANKRDRYFGFLPGRGIHNIHMNQGNPPGRFARDNGVYQDGALLFMFPRQQQWAAIFLKFETQAWHTDDKSGDVLQLGGGGPPADAQDAPGVIRPDDPPTSAKPDGLVRVIAALVNDIGSPEKEFVTLLNTSSSEIRLDGWSLKDRAKNAQPLGGVIPAGETLRVAVESPLSLSNQGGLITLLDDRGVKVHGVSYTRSQASQPGRTLAFHR